jgi:predicted RNA-binding protein with PUA-like domain
MAYWLLKTEPECYAWTDLQRDKETRWDGVANALALKHLRAMKPGDEAIFYHTGNQKAAVGTARITSAPYADPNESDERLTVVDLKPVRALPRPVLLSEIKADPAFAGWDLLRIGRLSVVPVPPAMWEHLMRLAEAPGEGAAAGRKPAGRASATAKR